MAQGTSTNGVARREARAFPTCSSPKKPVPFWQSLYSGRNSQRVQKEERGHWPASQSNQVISGCLHEEECHSHITLSVASLKRNQVCGRWLYCALWVMSTICYTRRLSMYNPLCSLQWILALGLYSPCLPPTTTPLTSHMIYSGQVDLSSVCCFHSFSMTFPLFSLIVLVFKILFKVLWTSLHSWLLVFLFFSQISSFQRDLSGPPDPKSSFTSSSLVTTYPVTFP